MIVEWNRLPCDVCGGAIRHVPNCATTGGTYRRMIQLKWSDETVWKDLEPVEEYLAAQLDRLKASWAKEKAQNNLKHDAEFRIKPEQE
jgi:hypothetical protein